MNKKLKNNYEFYEKFVILGQFTNAKNTLNQKTIINKKVQHSNKEYIQKYSIDQYHNIF